MGAFILVKFNGAESKYRPPPIYDRVISETRPVEAIKFRMEQAGLKAKDLIPYIGSASKVSEVLAGKRALSLTMMRNLVKLGIPAEVLLQEEGAKLPSDATHQYSPVLRCLTTV